MKCNLQVTIQTQCLISVTLIERAVKATEGLMIYCRATTQEGRGDEGSV